MSQSTTSNATAANAAKGFTMAATKTTKANKASKATTGNSDAKLAAAKATLAVVCLPTLGGNKTSIAGYSLCNVAKWAGSQGWHTTYFGAMLAYLGAKPKRSTLNCQVGSGRASVQGGNAHHGEPPVLAANVGEALATVYAYAASLPVNEVQALFASLPASEPKGKRHTLQPYLTLAAPATTANPRNVASPAAKATAKAK